jgi:hypothetical protein
LGSAAIQAHRPFEDAKGAALVHPVDEGAVELACFRLAHRFNHLDARLAQLCDAVAGNAWIGIAHRHHHAFHAGGDQGLAAGGGAAVVAAGLQRHHGGAVVGPRTGASQGMHLSVGCTGPLVKPLAHRSSLGIEHHAAHQGIRAGAACAEAGQLQGPLHPGPPGIAHPPIGRG